LRAQGPDLIGRHLVGIAISEMTADVVDDIGDLPIIQKSTERWHRLSAIDDDKYRIGSRAQLRIACECGVGSRTGGTDGARHVAPLAYPLEDRLAALFIEAGAGLCTRKKPVSQEDQRDQCACVPPSPPS
jgi:hypothetical protein